MTIVPFQFDNFSIRIITIHGEPWFVGKDIADALGYSDTVNAVKLHCKGVAKYHPIVDSLGRTQNARIINEPDLFRLIVNSQLPAAERFEKWVFEEVLPTIRKTGGYHTKPASPQDEFKRALTLTPLAVKALRALGCDKNGAAIGANQLIRKQTHVDLLALSGNTHLVAENQSSGYYTPTELGKHIGLSAQKVNKLLEMAGLQKRMGDTWEVTPTAQPHYRRFDTMRRHSDGTPVTQVKWATSVLPVIQTA